MKTSIISLKVDESLKNEAAKVADELGIPLATYLKLCLKRLVREQRIDFQLLEIPKELTRERWLKQQQDVQNNNKLSQKLNTPQDLKNNLN